MLQDPPLRSAPREVTPLPGEVGARRRLSAALCFSPRLVGGAERGDEEAAGTPRDAPGAPRPAGVAAHKVRMLGVSFCAAIYTVDS